MSSLRRVASALLALGLALGAFSTSPAPVRAEESGAGLSATVFAFDFSGSIFCYVDGAKDPSCKNEINKALSEAVEALADEISADASKYTARKIDFHVTRFGSKSNGSVSVCRGNTSTQTALPPYPTSVNGVSVTIGGISAPGRLVSARQTGERRADQLSGALWGQRQQRGCCRE